MDVERREETEEGASLGDELGTLADVVAAVVVLLERAPAGSAASVLALLEARLRLVRAVVVGAFPGAVVLARHNRRGAVLPDEDGDVVLPPRGPRSPQRRRR